MDEEHSVIDGYQEAEPIRTSVYDVTFTLSAAPRSLKDHELSLFPTLPHAKIQETAMSAIHKNDIHRSVLEEIPDVGKENGRVLAVKALNKVSALLREDKEIRDIPIYRDLRESHYIANKILKKISENLQKRQHNTCESTRHLRS